MGLAHIKRIKMSTYNTKQISDCIISFIENNNLTPVLISLTLVFGSHEEEEETPELLVGLLTCDEYKSWMEDEDFLESILNQAEYEYQEIAYECFENSIKIKKGLSREDYISQLMNVKQTIIQELNNIFNYDIFVYVHDLDDFDYDEIFRLNFTKEEQEKILSRNIC